MNEDDERGSRSTVIVSIYDMLWFLGCRESTMRGSVEKCGPKAVYK